MLSLKNLLLAFFAGVIASATAQTTAPQRINYDLVQPGDDATSRPYTDVTAVSDNHGRDKWLLDAAIATDYRESTSTGFVFYKGLVDGNETEDLDGDPYVSTLETFGSNVGRQPVGPLTGRVVFCSAGHGWTNDNTSTSIWYTQRPDTHGIVEDMGNLDQMNLYADICFRAGATIVPLRPIGFQHVERIIDNVSGHVQFYGQWADSKSTESFGFAGAKIPYRFARAAAEESAVARFRPVIPETDVYPVYTWARAGADRVIQTYRVVHAGGVNEVDVDHRRVGNGWVYLGSYVFRAGAQGYVEITNQVRDARQAAEGGVVIADAIRFGNGMGDINRGGGISGFPREEEASRYWVERSLSDGVAPIYNGFPDRADQSNNVGSAPRFAAHMNRETEGSFFDRVFMSFHSNASGGRGVVGLYNAHAILRPDKQIELAKLAADELNAEMTRSGIKLKRPWHVNGRRTDGHINFGEIRKDYLHNEMSATIVEVAYHDNADDAALLRQLSVRRDVAEAAYRTTVRYFQEVGGSKLDYFAPPAPPKLLSVKRSPTTGTVELQWTAAQQDPLSSPTLEITYKIYRSTDGIAFDQGKDVGAHTRFAVNKIKLNHPVYFRVTAVSPGGESLPSAVLGTAVAAGPRVLIAQGVATVTDDASVTQTAAANLGWALRPGGSFVRLVPRIMNNGEQVRVIGSGANRLRLGFDSIDESLITAKSDFSDYAAICIMMGRNRVAQELASTGTLSKLHDFVTSGGRLLLSGGCLAECEGVTTDSLARWGEFSASVLQTSYEPQTTVTELIKSGDRDLTTVTLQLGDRSLRYFEPRPTEVLKPGEAGRPVLAYKNFEGIAAVATLLDRKIRTAVIGFPLEELDDRDEQSVLVAQILLAMGMESPAPSKEEKGKSGGKIVIEDARPASKTAVTTRTASSSNTTSTTASNPQTTSTAE